MFLFLRLYLAHLLGDFVLQFDELYKLKVKSRLGHVLHVLIHLGCSVLLTWPYRREPILWGFLVALIAIHFIQDCIKYDRMKNRSKAFIYFVVDQFFHLLFVAAILLFPISQLTLTFPEGSFLNTYYANDRWILMTILFILVTFGGSYLFYNYRINYLDHTRPDHGITSPEMIHAIFERTIIASIFLLAEPGVIWALAPLAGLYRLPFKKLRNMFDYIFSFFYAAFLGLLFRLWI